MGELITYNEALQIIESQSKNFFSQQNETIEIGITEAVGHQLAEDIFSEEFIPQFTNSAMDGFSVRLSDFKDLQPLGTITLDVLQCVAAGDWPALEDRQNIAIETMTGAPILSQDFDSVIKIEEVELIKNSEGRTVQIKVSHRPQRGENIRKKGNDIKKGDKILSKLSIIQSQHILVLASLGIDRIKIKKPIDISLLSTGNEIMPYDQKIIGPGQIRNSTAPFLKCFLKEYKIDLNQIGHINDDKEQIKLKINEFLQNEKSQILLTTGAVSMGKFDYIKPCLIELGAQIHFHKCSIRPGKPILFSSITFKNKTKYIFGLPGNAISTTVGTIFFLLPFLNIKSASKLAELTDDVKGPSDMTCFFKACIFEKDGKQQVTVFKSQGSAVVSTLLESNAWAILEPQTNGLTSKGTHIRVIKL